MHHILFYDVVDDYVEKRAFFRDAHLNHAREAHARGELALGGALVDPVDGAVLVFNGPSPATAEAFAKYLARHRGEVIPQPRRSRSSRRSRPPRTARTSSRSTPSTAAPRKPTPSWTWPSI